MDVGRGHVCALRVGAHMDGKRRAVDHPQLEEDVLRRDGHDSVRRVEAHPFVYIAITLRCPPRPQRSHHWLTVLAAVRESVP